jgi:hypothetical protein
VGDDHEVTPGAVPAGLDDDPGCRRAYLPAIPLIGEINASVGPTAVSEPADEGVTSLLPCGRPTVVVRVTHGPDELLDDGERFHRRELPLLRCDLPNRLRGLYRVQEQGGSKHSCEKRYAEKWTGFQ